ncbi:MAG: diguanylate cyclase [Acidobacteriota bacterium]|nr:diguanylate cyclase [Acidobacteriota bacterium]
MNAAITKKYKWAIETILSELTPEEAESLEPQLQPLRIYINDIGRFHTPQIFVSKFRKFLEARDRIIALSLHLEEGGFTAEARQYQDAINSILEQVLDLLSNGLGKTRDITEDIEDIIDKVEKARSINNIRSLSEIFVQAGRSMVQKTRSLQDGLSKLSNELTRCKSQIEDLETQLVETREKAEHDHLTKLRNRRAFERDLDEAVERAHRFKNPMCLLLLDLDHFKNINDTYGHQVGDDVLVNFARLIQGSLRDFDLIYRLGGDEFAVIFSGCTLERAAKVGERVRKFLAEHQYRDQDLEFSLTMSAGLAQLTKGENGPSLYKRTDGELYRAKHGGRNRVSVAERREPVKEN